MRLRISCAAPGRLAALLALASATLLLACGGPGDPEDTPPPAIRPPESVRQQGELLIPQELIPHVQYWSDANWQAGDFPLNIAGEPLVRRRALMYYSCAVGPYVRPSTLVVLTTECAQGEKDAVLRKLCQGIGFAISEQTYSPQRKAETYYIWIQEFWYSAPSLAWLSDYILTTYQEDCIAVRPILSDRPFGGHNGGWGGGF